MCNSKEILKRSPTTPRSPYRRHLREMGKLRLSRSVVKSARVNLNHYWKKFEELSTLKLPTVELHHGTTANVVQLNFDQGISEYLSKEFEELGK